MQLGDSLISLWNTQGLYVMPRSYSPIFSQTLYRLSGYFLLADGGYPCLEKPITIRTPYKLPFQGQRQGRYNCYHSRARSVVERACGMMKAWWRATFCRALEVSPAFAPNVIPSCAFFHNLCLKMNDIVELEDNIMPSPGSSLGHTRWMENTREPHQGQDGCSPVCTCRSLTTFELFKLLDQVGFL